MDSNPPAEKSSGGFLYEANRNEPTLVVVLKVSFTGLLFLACPIFFELDPAFPGIITTKISDGCQSRVPDEFF